MTKAERIEAMWLAYIKHAGPPPIDWRRGMEAAYDAADVEGMVREAIRLADRGEGSVPEFTADQIVGRVCGNE